MTTVAVSRCGDSLAVRFPEETREEANLHEGDRFAIYVEGGHLVLARENQAER